jgi:hypothetical protein
VVVPARVTAAVADTPRERSTESSGASQCTSRKIGEVAFSPGQFHGVDPLLPQQSWKNTMLARRLVAAQRPRNQAWMVGGDCSPSTSAPLSPDHDDML